VKLGAGKAIAANYGLAGRELDAGYGDTFAAAKPNK
jgi:hypothetical protein